MKNIKQNVFYLIMLLGIEIALGYYLKRWEIVTFFLILNTLFFIWVALYLQKKNVIDEKMERQVDISAKIAHETLPYLRRGLNEKNAEAIARIIIEIAQVAAVSITDCEKQLAYIGVGCDRHHPGDKILTEATREVVQKKQHKIVQTQKELNCPLSDICECPLAEAVIVPLICQNKVVGTFKLYETKDGKISPDLIRLAIGMGQILSLQVEIAELQYQAKLTTEAKLDALQAQINPHFFFNVMNTIISTSRTNPNRARRLLIHFSEFFRKVLKSKGSVISLKEEMEFVNTYLVLEKARFGKILKIKEEIPLELMEVKIPRLSIQPLVENAVKHGITSKIGGGTVWIKVERIEAENGEDKFKVKITDDGMGIEEERLKDVLLQGVGSGNGVGMANVHARLQGLYGEEYGLKIESKINVGTSVTMCLPYSSVLGEEEL
ncbi:MAG: histidine kinase [Eubacteriales bacterium]